MQLEMQLIDQVFQSSLAKAVWEMDETSIAAQLDSVGLASSLGRVELRIIRSGRSSLVIERQVPTYGQSGLVPTLKHDLTVTPYEGLTEKVGELTIEGSEEVLWARLFEEISIIILTQMLQSMALAGLIMGVFNRSVTTHIRKIALHLRNISTGTLDHKLNLDRPSSVEDELTMLKTGVNDLQDKLAEYLVRQRADEKAMTASHAKLADLVKARTHELEQLNMRLEELSSKDALTGLANRRQFEEAKEREFSLAKDRCTNLAVLMCDVDFFKLYNDTLGHGAGDECLKAVSRVIQYVAHQSNALPARYGGEEFAVLMPGASIHEAHKMANAIKQLLHERCIPHPSSSAAQFVTLSIGVAELKHNKAGSFDELLKHADDALYRAKRLGRDQVSS